MLNVRGDGWIGFEVNRGCRGSTAGKNKTLRLEEKLYGLPLEELLISATTGASRLTALSFPGVLGVTVLLGLVLRGLEITRFPASSWPAMRTGFCAAEFFAACADRAASATPDFAFNCSSPVLCASE